MGMGQITQADFEAMDTLFERFIPKYKEIWLFGTGTTTTLGTTAF
jgi:hypothetical protein